MQKPAILIVAVLALTAIPLSSTQAQDTEEQGQVNGKAFFPGNGVGWTFGYPSLDVNAGLHSTLAGNVMTSQAFIRAHIAMNTGIPHLAVSADVNWIPARGATPVVSFVGQIDPLSRQSDFYVSVGAGLITGHVVGDKFAGWVQAVVAYRTPIHQLTPFVQAGRALSSQVERSEFLFGIAHPLAPYRLHL